MESRIRRACVVDPKLALCSHVQQTAKTNNTARYTDAYLETGPNNRLVLSIRSGVPAEIDFGLDRLVQMTSIEPDLVRLSEFSGLLDGCLALVRDYLERRKADRERGLPALAAIVGQEARSVLRRRAGEAALILRNLAPESRSRDPLLASKKLVRTICDVLEEGQSDALDGEETTEIRIYLLDVLECIAEHIPLALPGHPIAAGAADAADDGDKPPPKPEALDSPAVRLFPLLVALTRSSDRALLLAGFRTLTALALNGKSDAVFALLAYNGIEPLPKPHPHPIQTAVELLPVADTELNLAILEFIYQHTLLPSNAVLFAERPELVGILRLLISKFHVRAKLEEVSIDLRVAPFDGRYYHDLHGIKHVRKPTPNPVQPTDSLVSPEELAHLITLVEPSRTLTWMRTAFEADPASSVPQVVLWTSYRTQFEPHARPDLPPLLAAAEVIKASQQAFPNVLPMVSEEGGQRNFVIKGLKIRDRPGTRPFCLFFLTWAIMKLTAQCVRCRLAQSVPMSMERLSNAEYARFASRHVPARHRSASRATGTQMPVGFLHLHIAASRLAPSTRRLGSAPQDAHSVAAYPGRRRVQPDRDAVHLAPRADSRRARRACRRLERDWDRILCRLDDPEPRSDCQTRG